MPRFWKREEEEVSVVVGRHGLPGTSSLTGILEPNGANQPVPSLAGNAGMPLSEICSTQSSGKLHRWKDVVLVGEKQKKQYRLAERHTQQLLREACTSPTFARLWPFYPQLPLPGKTDKGKLAVFLLRCLEATRSEFPVVVTCWIYFVPRMDYVRYAMSLC